MLGFHLMKVDGFHLHTDFRSELKVELVPFVVPDPKIFFGIAVKERRGNGYIPRMWSGRFTHARADNARKSSRMIRLLVLVTIPHFKRNGKPRKGMVKSKVARRATMQVCMQSSVMDEEKVRKSKRQREGEGEVMAMKQNKRSGTETHYSAGWGSPSGGR